MFKPYEIGEFYDEMLQGIEPKQHYRMFYTNLEKLTDEEINRKQKLAQSSFMRQGITFTVYGEKGGTERTMPFDFVPIILPAETWKILEEGMKQRVQALNFFLEDVYGEQRIIKDGIIPEDLIVENQYYYPQVCGVKIPLNNHIFLAGIDLIRDEHGVYRILEDNLRCPSGMSYVFQNRYVMKEVYPEFFSNHSLQSLEHQINYLKEALLAHKPRNMEDDAVPQAVLLTAGMYNSAYYDHVFLAKQMNIPLVEGRDLIINDDYLYMKTIKGLKRVHIVYRRIDDDFLDPKVFRDDSLLGVPGIMECYEKGNVTIVNGIGNGVADDKAIYTYVPKMIQYYLNEKPLLDNVETYLLRNEDDLDYVLSNLEKLVVKNVGASGGYDMLIGPHATSEQLQRFREKIIENPKQYIAQPTIKLSRAPVYQNGRFYPCHIDLRVFVMKGKEIRVLPGGLSRVALKEGSLVVNSSQGGGGKDTWVLKGDENYA